jgi:hypothetical protein
MKDAFKVKKGLNVQPTDPAEVVNPEAGDLIVDSTDDNRLKVYDPTSSEFAAVGTGGSSGNILSDIEKLTPTVSNVVAVTDTTTFLPIDDNNKSVKATFSGSDGSIRYEGPASADLDGVQGVVKVWIKTDVEGLSLVATKDGVAQNNGLTVNSTNKWRQYEIPVVLGDADYGFEIQASGAVSGDVYIDEAFVTVEAVIRNLGAAHFVGEISWGSSNCQWINNTSGVWGSFPADADCTGIIKGSVQEADIKIPAVKIPNARTDGYYKISFNGNAGTSSGATPDICSFSLSSTSDYENNNSSSYTTTETTAGADGSRFTHYFEANYRFNDNDSKTIQVISRPVFSGDSCSVWGSSTNGLYSKLSVHFYPDDTSTIVTQDTELTAKTANEFSAKISSDGSIISQNYDFIDSCSWVSGVATCNFKTGIFNVVPSVNALVNDFSSSIFNTEVTSVSTSQFTVRSTFQSTGGGGNGEQARSFSVLVSKQGADVNKSATIVGKFENINDTPIDSLSGDQAGSQAITANVSNIDFFGSVLHDETQIKTSVNTFSPKISGVYTLKGSLQFSAPTNGTPILYKNNISTGIKVGRSVSQEYSIPILRDVKLEAGETYSIRHNSSGTLSSSWLDVRATPDLAAIIKNLSNQKVECQTKILGGDTSSAGEIATLKFSNLTIGKKYRANIHGYISSTAILALRHDGNDIARLYLSSSGAMINSSSTPVFTATNTELNTFNIIAATVFGNGTLGETWVELCELPDTYVETTKF